jgi:hypothetical protein
MITSAMPSLAFASCSSVVPLIPLLTLQVGAVHIAHRRQGEQHRYHLQKLVRQCAAEFTHLFVGADQGSVEGWDAGSEVGPRPLVDLGLKLS